MWGSYVGSDDVCDERSESRVCGKLHVDKDSVLQTKYFVWLLTTTPAFVGGVISFTVVGRDYSSSLATAEIKPCRPCLWGALRLSIIA